MIRIKKLKPIVLKEYIRDQEALDFLSYAQKALALYINSPMNGISSHDFETLTYDFPLDQNTTVYRGLNFATKENYDKFIESIKDGYLETGSYTSWSPSKSVAKQFAVTRPTYMEYMSDEDIKLFQEKSKHSERIVGYRGVILKTTAKKFTCIDVRKFEYASEEEILLPEGKYRVQVENILSYKDEIGDDIDGFIDRMKKSSVEKDFAYIVANYKPEDVSEESISKIYKLTKPNKELLTRYGTRFEDNGFLRKYEPSAHATPDKLYVGVSVVPPYLLDWWPSDKVYSYLENVRKRIIKASKEAEKLYKENTQINLSDYLGWYANKTGAMSELGSFLRNTAGKDYHKDTRYINNLKGKEQQKAIEAEMKRIKDLLGGLN